VALLLYAIAAGDVALGVVGAVIVVVAPTAHLVIPGRELLVFGVVAGAAMATLGILRTRRPRW